eukprot:TRINITY_DN314_c0_g1_i4.p1 TRINITY_DN314_c0_g1~~TRINITY_DN314_c0_g1_i4.p1  ORF type:complete len:545 (+),score=143.76 TRINITY_DN314_c0_g1_i4:16-1650(+)
MQTPIDTRYVQMVELRIRCESLLNLDVLSKSDPLVSVLQREGPQSDAWKEIARTEMIQNDLNPRFSRAISLPYRFEETQELWFKVWDVDGKETDPTDGFDFLGDVKCTLGEIVSQGSRFKKDISKGGHLFISSEAISNANFSISMQLSGLKLDKKDVFGKSDPYLIFYKTNGTERFPVHKTEIVMNTLNPTWNPITIHAQDLCNGDLKRPVYVECFDWDKVGEHDLIGAFTTTTEELLMPAFPRSFPLINPKKKEKKGSSYENSGSIILSRSESVKDYNFIDYLQGGMEINLVVAVDFTGSNGVPSTPTSLHYFSGTTMNSYQEAIMSVGSVLEYYDSDKLFPIYGFGMKLPNGEVSHCYPLSGNPQQPMVAGVAGMIQAYNTAIQQYTLWGPTYFAGIIKSASEFTAQNRLDATKQKYTILLIITDGEINDMPATTDAIIEGSELPMSIIIVGVGNADFSCMDKLDADTTPLVHSRTGKKSLRDIVQFVPYNKFKGQHPSMLAREVLYEVPAQVVSYMNSAKLKPLAIHQTEALASSLAQAHI